MLLALADTHGRGNPRLSGHLRERLAAADCTVHAGDFATAAVLDAFATLSDRLVAVHGNSDNPAVRERLSAVETVEALGSRFLVVHGHDHDRTSLSLLARQEDADVVVRGHTHRPVVERLGDVVVLNPGSHASPRGGSRPAYATVEGDDDGLHVQLRERAGEPFESVRV